MPLVEGFALGPFATNCYLVHLGPGGEGWIVDASHEPSPMIDRARQLELRISQILMTHAHGDHIAGLDDVRAAFPGVPVLGHRAEAAFYGDPNLNLSAGFAPAIRTAPPDRMLDGGETIKLGETEWRVIHLPGHSPGGIAFYCEAAKMAIAGDTLFAGSIGRVDFPTSDPAAMRESLQTLCTLPDDTRVLPGHGPTTTIGREKKSNPYIGARL